ncbi:MAG: hypothetical protein K2G24_02740 [Muribaculaceae bacterium]|nr:hypothetical protein [Muribaculaceae bacterium]
MICLDIPLLAWCVVAATMVALVMVRTFIYANSRLHRKNSAHAGKATPGVKFFEIGSEREEFFLPGDRNVTAKDYSDEYDG